MRVARSWLMRGQDPRHHPCAAARAGDAERIELAGRDHSHGSDASSLLPAMPEGCKPRARAGRLITKPAAGGIGGWLTARTPHRKAGPVRGSVSGKATRQVRILSRSVDCVTRRCDIEGAACGREPILRISPPRIPWARLGPLPPQGRPLSPPGRLTHTPASTSPTWAPPHRPSAPCWPGQPARRHRHRARVAGHANRAHSCRPRPPCPPAFHGRCAAAPAAPRPGASGCPEPSAPAFTAHKNRFLPYAAAFVAA